MASSDVGRGGGGSDAPPASDENPAGGSPNETPLQGGDSPQPTSGAQASRGVVGTVRSTGGQPVEGALVQPRALDPNAPAVPEIAAYTGPDGRYSWDLPPGRWELTVSADGYRPATRQVTIEAGGPATLDFTLEPAG